MEREVNTEKKPVPEREAAPGKKPAEKKPVTVGICGGTGSGKTTLAERISEAFGNDAVLIGMDTYYKDYPELSFAERAKMNYDHPDAFDTELFLSHIRALKEGKAIDMPTYDYAGYARKPECRRVESRRLVIVEGILLFENQALVNELDIKLFVDTDADVRLARRLLRDVKERGRTLDSVVSQYLGTVKPMHEQFVEPYKRRADIIVPEGGHNRVALTMLIDSIRRKLAAED